jgi:competence protein ComEC
MYSKIVGEDYYLAFLSPLGESLTANYYDEFNLLENPNDRQVNNLSPIIYLQYKGVKFVFTGDAGISQENMVVESYRAGVYDFIHGKKVSLDNVDFLKVGHHGSADSTGQTFVNLLTPKNAIVSVGGNNVYGHPSTTTFTRLQQANQDIKVFRTDVLGTISIGVNGQGLSKIYN